MSTLVAEPVSPTFEYEEDQEPELEGLRNLSVSTDGTLDSLDENPTPPHSPTPIVHISPPGAKFPLLSSDSPRFFSFEDSVFGKTSEQGSKKPTLEPIDPLFRPRSPFLQSLPSYSDVPPTPPAVKLAFPSLPSKTTPPPVTETLAERRASLGKLSNKALLSLQQMRFESSEDAGMGLGVGPPSAGLEGSEGEGGPSPGKQIGKTFQLAMGFDNELEPDYSAPPPLVIPKSPLLAAPGIENDGRQLQRSRSTGSLRRTRSHSSIRSTTRPYSVHSPSSPSSPRAPLSPMVQRSSAFVSANNGPLTPLTPSHVPGAPALGNSGSSAFEYFSFSAPESPVSPSFPPNQQKLPHFDQFASQPALPLTPTSDSGSITPTGSTHRIVSHQRATSRSRLPTSPLGRGRFDEGSDSTDSNPFFATD
ncbi:hypothetical protein JCM3765_002162 [Sporobolomyces pararoseus]